MSADVAAPVDERLDFLAIALAEKAWEKGTTVEQLREFLRDEATSLAEFARQVRDEYVRILPGVGETPTAAQGVTFARLVRTHQLTGLLRTSYGGFGLPDGYVEFELFDLVPDGRGGTSRAIKLDGGIDRDGQAST